jgi:hypothetical protein
VIVPVALAVLDGLLPFERSVRGPCDRRAAGLRQCRPVMVALFSLLAYDREDLMVAALAGLIVAGVVVAIGAWLLMFRDAKRRSRDADAWTEPADISDAGSRSPEP